MKFTTNKLRTNPEGDVLFEFGAKRYAAIGAISVYDAFNSVVSWESELGIDEQTLLEVGQEHGQFAGAGGTLERSLRQRSVLSDLIPNRASVVAQSFELPAFLGLAYADEGWKQTPAHQGPFAFQQLDRRRFRGVERREHRVDEGALRVPPPRTDDGLSGDHPGDRRYFRVVAQDESVLFERRADPLEIPRDLGRRWLHFS
jgi:hypothetical protein